MGIGRVMHSDKFPEGMLQLFFLTSMRRTYRKAVIDALKKGNENEVEDPELLLPYEKEENNEGQEYLF